MSVSESPSGYYAIFQEQQRLSTEDAIAFVESVSCYLDKCPITYAEIPHSLSAISHNGHGDMHISAYGEDEKDLRHIEEEAFMAPPEAQTDSFWRQNCNRMTYLVSQLFVALLTGKNPGQVSVNISAQDLLTRHSLREIAAIQRFLKKGMDVDPVGRFQSFNTFIRQLEELRQELFSSNITARNLPKLSRLYQRLIYPDSTPVDKRSFVVHVWTPKYEKAAKLVLTAPAVLVVGRKTKNDNQQSGDGDKLPIDMAEDITPICHLRQIKDNAVYHTVLVEGDPCLSRRHFRIDFFEDTTRQLLCQDLGSTHGGVIYLDSDCSHHNCRNIASGETTELPSLSEQYLQLGNTYLRIRIASQKQDK